MIHFTIITAKIMILFMKLLKRGSVYPGALAEKMCNKLLSKIKVKSKIIVVTGTNGKTSTTNILANSLSELGCTIGYNSEGSNMYNGILTMYLKNCNIFGKIKKDYIIIEMDEFSSNKILPIIKPDYLIILNLYSDQLERLGSIDNVVSRIEDGLEKSKETTIITSRQQPVLVNSFNGNRKLYFRISYNNKKNEYRVVCPECNNALEYKRVLFTDIGDFVCSHCDFPHDVDNYLEMNHVNLEKGIFKINKQEFSVPMQTIYFFYNYMAVITMLYKLGFTLSKISKVLQDYQVNNGRWETIEINNSNYVLNLTKNAVGLQEVLKAIDKYKNKIMVFIFNNTTDGNFKDTSWLWDVDFETMKLDNISKVYCGGLRAYDVANRLEVMGISSDNIIVDNDIENIINKLDDEDEDKFIMCTRLPLSMTRKYLLKKR